eukprot:TRINITY_DN4360_c0_g1_i3.p1 TRINITY_DN4360_c0_g1~~TRINITY_DN4360_c0_g1_i3.p1  ORF type:complete len:730 (+),score=71.66 TRINITY_DN4360_c0_g1_i3:93-2282(+)
MGEVPRRRRRRRSVSRPLRSRSAGSPLASPPASRRHARKRTGSNPRRARSQCGSRVRDSPSLGRRPRGRRGMSRRRRGNSSPSPGRAPRSRSRSRSGANWQPPSRDAGFRRHEPREQKPEGCRTIWIGWTDGRPKEEDIVEFFKDCGGITEVRISDHQVRGYFAHVQFEDTTCVDLAMKKQGDEFMGRRIQLDYAYMDKVMTNPQAEANAPGRILRCKPKSVKPEGGRTLWLGDLSIDSTEQDVIDFFEPCGKIEMICLKVNQLRNGHFGHVKFFDTEAVDKAADLAGTLLKGVPVRMDYAEDKPLAAYRAGKDQGVPQSKRPEDCRTIWVGGLPSEVSEAMIREFFERSGEIKEVRLDTGKRGFAQFCHVEFVEGTSVDRAIRYSGDRLGGAKIRVDFAENRKNDPIRRVGLPVVQTSPAIGDQQIPGLPPGWVPSPGMGPPLGMGMPPPGMGPMPPGLGPPPGMGGPGGPALGTVPPGATPPGSWLGPRPGLGPPGLGVGDWPVDSDSRGAPPRDWRGPAAGQSGTAPGPEKSNGALPSSGSLALANPGPPGGPQPVDGGSCSGGLQGGPLGGPPGGQPGGHPTGGQPPGGLPPGARPPPGYLSGWPPPHGFPPGRGPPPPGPFAPPGYGYPGYPPDFPFGRPPGPEGYWHHGPPPPGYGPGPGPGYDDWRMPGPSSAPPGHIGAPSGDPGVPSTAGARGRSGSLGSGSSYSYSYSYTPSPSRSPRR